MGPVVPQVKPGVSGGEMVLNWFQQLQKGLFHIPAGAQGILMNWQVEPFHPQPPSDQFQ